MTISTLLLRSGLTLTVASVMFVSALLVPQAAAAQVSLEEVQLEIINRANALTQYVTNRSTGDVVRDGNGDPVTNPEPSLPTSGNPDRNGFSGTNAGSGGMQGGSYSRSQSSSGQRSGGFSVRSSGAGSMQQGGYSGGVGDWAQARQSNVQRTSAEQLKTMDRDEIMALIRQLTQLLRTRTQSSWSGAEQAQERKETTTRTREVEIGDEVVTLERLRVRSQAGVSGEAVRTVARSARGTVEKGPEERDGYTWWYISYADGTAGWSAGQWLRVVKKAQTVGGDDQFPNVIITPPTGVAPLEIKVLSRHDEDEYPELEITFGDDDTWTDLNGCAKFGDTVCVDAGATGFTYETGGTFTVALRNGVLERDVKKVRVLDTSRTRSTWGGFGGSTDSRRQNDADTAKSQNYGGYAPGTTEVDLEARYCELGLTRYCKDSDSDE